MPKFLLRKHWHRLLNFRWDGNSDYAWRNIWKWNTYYVIWHNYSWTLNSPRKKFDWRKTVSHWTNVRCWHEKFFLHKWTTVWFVCNNTFCSLYFELGSMECWHTWNIPGNIQRERRWFDGCPTCEGSSPVWRITFKQVGSHRSKKTTLCDDLPLIKLWIRNTFVWDK